MFFFFMGARLYILHVLHMVNYVCSIQNENAFETKKFSARKNKTEKNKKIFVQGVNIESVICSQYVRSTVYIVQCVQSERYFCRGNVN